jgi:nitrite reductase (NADH) large subunit
MNNGTNGRQHRNTPPTGSPESSPTNPSQGADRLKLVVVGNGMVGFKFCERLAVHGGLRRYQVTVLGEEKRPAYDRVNLTSMFSGRSADDLLMADADWYAERGIELITDLAATAIEPHRRVVSVPGREFPYDVAVLCTGSSPFVPPIQGVELPGVFVYRTIEDVEAIRGAARRGRRAAVLGGGLLGLEAAKAVHDLGMDVTIVELGDWLMMRQIDPAGGRLLREKIEEVGVQVKLGAQTRAVAGDGAVRALQFADGSELEIDMLIVSVGIRPRDELARAAGLQVGPRGGIVIDDALRTSDPAIFAIGECALHAGSIYGLVAPGYAMADALAVNLAGGEQAFQGADLSTKLKLMGIEVANVGVLPPPDRPIRNVVFDDPVSGVYKRLVLDASGRQLLAAVLVGDASAFGMLQQIHRGDAPLPELPSRLIVGEGDAGSAVSADALGDRAQICSCNNVCKGAIREAIREGDLSSLADVKGATKAATGCGACANMVQEILDAELKAAGRSVNKQLCEHFAFTRQELFQIVRVNKIKSFAALLEKHGRGNGCEVCKPAVASILASLWNENVFDHKTIQDTNDRFLANIQRQGTYSVVPRVPGGEITPDKLIALGTVARKYNLYCKITGGQRVDLFGARVDQLPDIWEELIAAGFESGHAYGKALRTVKSCVGTTWCRYGVQDSVGFAIRVENRYKGIRAPHKLKSAVSGCLRECAEARGKDFGYIATDKGYNLYVCGNGGINPRHAQLIASDLSEDEAIRLTDRFLMYYIHTADKLTRTADWLERMDGGLEHLKEVIIEDKLGICKQLEEDMERLARTYQCEWAAVVNDPARRRQFRHFADRDGADENLRMVPERAQHRPVAWPASDQALVLPPAEAIELGPTGWVRVASAADVPAEGGIAIQHGDVQLALFHFASRGEWFATQNMCPHKRDMVLARGLLGDAAGEPKVACPLHKKTFSLRSGDCLSGDPFRIMTFPVHVEGDEVFVELPEADVLAKWLAVKTAGSCAAACGSVSANPSFS